MSDIIARLNGALEGRYVLQREIGEGGMATVYLGEGVRHNRRVALKVLKRELAAVVGAERFLSEIETTADLQHPHILPLFDSGEATWLLIDGGFDATYVATGHLLFVDMEGGPWAQPFDVRRLETAGDAVPMISGLGVGSQLWAKYSISDGNAIYYRYGCGGERALLAARIRREPSFAVTTTDTVYSTEGVDRFSWDLHPDGDRSSVPVTADAASTDAPGGPAEPERFVVAVNWFAELRAIIGGK